MLKGKAADSDNNTLKRSFRDKRNQFVLQRTCLLWFQKCPAAQGRDADLWQQRHHWVCSSPALLLTALSLLCLTFCISPHFAKREMNQAENKAAVITNIPPGDGSVAGFSIYSNCREQQVMPMNISVVPEQFLYPQPHLCSSPGLQKSLLLMGCAKNCLVWSEWTKGKLSAAGFPQGRLDSCLIHTSAWSIYLLFHTSPGP